MDGVVERPQQADHVAEGRSFDAPLANRLIRATLKIDEHKVLAGGQDLVELAITMAANAGGMDGMVGIGAEFRKQVRRELTDLRNHVVQIRRDAIFLAIQ